MASKYDIVFQPALKAKQEQDSVAEDTNSDNPIYKTVIPQYMYKPAFGFPRYQPLGLLRQLGKNVYASSIFKTIKDIIIDTPYNIVVKEGIEETEQHRTLIEEKTKFFKKPNPDECYPEFIKKILDDLFKYDSGIINKVFNPFEELIQMRASPGDTFKKNPDKHGYLDSREDLILGKPAEAGQVIDNPEMFDSEAFRFYTEYIDKAAYFQYVNAVASQIPIPFGKREICWLTANPSTDNVYTNGSYLEDAIDIVLNLVYGSKYNLDFYANGNTPEGIINAVGATKKDLKKIKMQLDHSIKTPRDAFGMSRRMGYRMPIVNMDNIEFIKLNLSSQEMEIIEQQKWFTKILWMRFGLNADEMGFTENSNRATSTQQTYNSIRKAIKPIYVMLENAFTYDILSEFPGCEDLEFKFDFYDVNEQKAIRELQQLEINMGINSWQKIADEEGIDLAELQKHKQDDMQVDMDMFQQQAEISNTEPGETNNKEDDEKKPEMKSNIVKKADKWIVMNKGEVISKHDNKDEALRSLQSDHPGKDQEPLDVKQDDKEADQIEDEVKRQLPIRTPYEIVMDRFTDAIERRSKQLIDKVENEEER